MAYLNHMEEDHSFSWCWCLFIMGIIGLILVVTGYHLKALGGGVRLINTATDSLNYLNCDIIQQMFLYDYDECTWCKCKVKINKTMK